MKLSSAIQIRKIGKANILELTRSIMAMNSETGVATGSTDVWDGLGF